MNQAVMIILPPLACAEHPAALAAVGSGEAARLRNAGDLDDLLFGTLSEASVSPRIFAGRYLSFIRVLYLFELCLQSWH